MIRHIVFFKFKNDVSDKEREQLVEELVGLERAIDVVRFAEVECDIGKKDNSYDVVLNALFDSMTAVEEYAVHPEHVKVLATVKKLCDSTSKVDYATSLVPM